MEEARREQAISNLTLTRFKRRSARMVHLSANSKLGHSGDANRRSEPGRRLNLAPPAEGPCRRTEQDQCTGTGIQYQVALTGSDCHEVVNEPHRHRGSARYRFSENQFPFLEINDVIELRQERLSQDPPNCRGYCRVYSIKGGKEEYLVSRFRRA